MATKTKKLSQAVITDGGTPVTAVTPVTAEPQETQETVEAPVTITEDQARLLKMLTGLLEASKAGIPVREPVGRLIPVKCPLEGYEDVTVWYKTDNQYGLVQEPLPAGSPISYYYAKWALFIKRIEWSFTNTDGTPLPSPDPQHPETFEALHREMFALMRWATGPGYATAKEESQSPNS